MKRPSLLQGLTCVAVALFCLGWWGQVSAKPVDWIVAVVNDDIILESELEARVKAIAQASGQSLASAPQMGLLKKEVLRQMIRERLTAQEVARLKISVSDQEVEGALERIKEVNQLDDQQLAEMLRREGRTLEQFKDKIREDMERARLIERVLKSKTVITDDQVEAYLREQRNDPEEKRRLAVIFLSAGRNATERAAARQKAQEILAKLRDGADFAGLARAYSQGPGAENGGDIGYIKAKDLAGPLERVTRDLKVGGVSEVVESAAGFYIVKLLDVQRAALKNVDARLLEKARQELFQQEVNKKYEKWIRELEAKSFIQVHWTPPSTGS
ncbi:periplasmic chaperone for outer membrane proteins SurA [Desulfacinum hydrothermale DSM 13146]|uniref:Periplasmic chaperone for outer membrane proteins SurA n=1 Tax=Desulfacinum hydrothermale DSM 13146 TaxID=1121390 RepID=A0A1W1WY45_9BACT|nr:peptidylprolyl isomerase [Desulfacinum hydrothermale]SMC16348.1 periplasmic chaperone for outer membrane proteins SurA [Desulfacinum hydrothermale DSM 13146]